MNGGKLYRTLVAVFFIGILSSTFFMQGAGFKKKLSPRSVTYSFVADSADTQSEIPKQSPIGSGLLNEEEEEEEVHLRTEFVELPEAKSIIIIRSSFAPPTLFFKEYARDVMSPPPWA